MGARYLSFCLDEKEVGAALKGELNKVRIFHRGIGIQKFCSVERVEERDGRKVCVIYVGGQGEKEKVSPVIPGDVLYCREVYREEYNHAATKYEYKNGCPDESINQSPFPWRAPVTMPREIVRVFLVVDSVGVDTDGRVWWWDVKVHTIPRPEWWRDRNG